MRDLPGNKLDAGNLVYWRSKGLICKVIKVIEPNLSIKRDEIPTLVLEIGVPLLDQNPQRSVEAEANDFIRIMDPAAEAIVKGILQ